MDNLYLKVIDNQPVDNPVYGINLLEIYPQIPPEYKLFIRVEQNVTPLIYQNVTDTYQNVNGQWQDVWVAYEQTAEEQAATTAKINANGATQQQNFITNANVQIAKLTAEGDTQGVEVWNTYLVSINSWVMPPIDPNWTQATINYNFPKQPRQITIFNLGDGTGTFANTEIVYQSPDGLIENSTCQATTQNFNGWTPGSTLPVKAIYETFLVNTTIFGDISSAQYQLLSIGSTTWVIPT